MTTSSGNRAQAVALGASLLGASAIILIPPLAKLAGELGATIVHPPMTHE